MSIAKTTSTERKASALEFTVPARPGSSAGLPVQLIELRDEVATTKAPKPQDKGTPPQKPSDPSAPSKPTRPRGIASAETSREPGALAKAAEKPQRPCVEKPRPPPPPPRPVLTSVETSGEALALSMPGQHQPAGPSEILKSILKPRPKEPPKGDKRRRADNMGVGRAMFAAATPAPPPPAPLPIRPPAPAPGPTDGRGDPKPA